MPKAPLWLGAAGLIPFVSCAAGVAAGGVDLTPLSLSVTPGQLVHLQAVYGVSILSFMGAVHWGLAMTNYQRPPSARGSAVPTTLSETKEQDLPSSTGGNGEEWRYGLRCAALLDQLFVRVRWRVCALLTFAFPRSAVWCRA